MLLPLSPSWVFWPLPQHYTWRLAFSTLLTIGHCWDQASKSHPSKLSGQAPGILAKALNLEFCVSIPKSVNAPNWASCFTRSPQYNIFKIHSHTHFCSSCQYTLAKSRNIFGWYAFSPWNRTFSSRCGRCYDLTLGFGGGSKQWGQVLRKTSHGEGDLVQAGTFRGFEVSRCSPTETSLSQVSGSHAFPLRALLWCLSRPCI